MQMEILCNSRILCCFIFIWIGTSLCFRTEFIYMRGLLSNGMTKLKLKFWLLIHHNKYSIMPSIIQHFQVLLFNLTQYLQDWSKRHYWSFLWDFWHGVIKQLNHLHRRYVAHQMALLSRHLELYSRMVDIWPTMNMVFQKMLPSIK